MSYLFIPFRQFDLFFFFSLNFVLSDMHQLIIMIDRNDLIAIIGHSNLKWYFNFIDIVVNMRSIITQRVSMDGLGIYFNRQLADRLLIPLRIFYEFNLHVLLHIVAFLHFWDIQVFSVFLLLRIDVILQYSAYKIIKSVKYFKF